MDDISQDNFLLSKEYENSLDVDTKKQVEYIILLK